MPLVTVQPIRLLHISDLHFRSAPTLHDAPDFKVPPRELEDLLVTPDRAETFIRMATEIFRDNTPDAIIVSGDIVDKGGADRPANGPGEFTRATKFLMDLAANLHLDPAKVLVVPGNHDIDWTTEGPERFTNYLSAVEQFTSPHHLRHHTLAPISVTLTKGKIEVEVTLLASPLQSGVRAPWEQNIRQSVSDQLEDANLATDRYANVADIAVLGSEQRDYIVNQRERLPDGVKIAVLHHHLLPHTQIEFTPFEAVVDAGATIDSLINGRFDLALSGHKHCRRLQRLTVTGPGTTERLSVTGPGNIERRPATGTGTIDYYTSPSLFIQGPDNAAPGFTVIEVFGQDAPHYAILNYYDSTYPEPTRTIRLRPHGRLLPQLTAVLGDLSARDQTTLLPLLAAFRDGTAVRDRLGYAGIQRLFEDVLQRPQEELTALAAGTWTLRPPKLADQWEAFLRGAREWTIGAAGEWPKVKLASVNDLDYWEAGLDEARSHAARYGRPISQLPGEKFRILVLSESAFRIDGKAAQADRVIRHMTEEGYRVAVVRARGLPDRDYDFGVIGDIVAWNFTETEGEIRGLNLFFDQRTIQRRKWQWDELNDKSLWDNASGEGFLEWVNRRQERPIS
jgi:3',5'-cyclic AMP phosphodiesterase CpdA